jgi:hypothetical protein
MILSAAILVSVPAAFAQATPGEFKCELGVSRAAPKFVGAKSKCVTKCMKSFWKGTVPESDCLPPYGGTTATVCITDALSGVTGAEDRFRTAIQQACDPAYRNGTDCPECYGGDCSAAGYAGEQVQNIELQVDSFVPGVFCERTGATRDEQRCQANTAKVLAKLTSKVGKCYDTCKGNERNGLVAAGACDPPASDPATAACIAKEDGKAVVNVDKHCGVAAAPDNCGGPYPSGATWVGLVEIAIGGDVTGTYCEN